MADDPPRKAVSDEGDSGATRVGRYVLLDKLGEGAFGVVRYAVDERDGTEYAIKVLRKADIEAHALTVQVRREIAVMRAVRHQHVVRLYEVLASRTHLYLVMEFVAGGELFDKIAKSQLGHLDEETARMYFSQLCEAVSHLHSRRVYHRDLKPENLLLTADGTMLKVTDFGFASIKRAGTTRAEDELLSTVMGSPHYLPPEVIGGASAYDGAKADAWACGMILFAMLAGHLPFDDEKDTRLYAKILRDKVVYPAYFSHEVRFVLSALLEKNPAHRATVDHAKWMYWVSQAHAQGQGQPHSRCKSRSGSSQPAASKRKSRRRTRRESNASSAGKRDARAESERPGDVVAVRNVRHDVSDSEQHSIAGHAARALKALAVGATAPGEASGPLAPTNTNTDTNTASVLLPLHNARRTLAKWWLPSSTSGSVASDTSDDASGSNRPMKLLARRARAIRPRRRTTPAQNTCEDGVEEPTQPPTVPPASNWSKHQHHDRIENSQRTISPLAKRHVAVASPVAPIALPLAPVAVAAPLTTSVVLAPPSAPSLPTFPVSPTTLFDTQITSELQSDTSTTAFSLQIPLSDADVRAPTPPVLPSIIKHECPQTPPSPPPQHSASAFPVLNSRTNVETEQPSLPPHRRSKAVEFYFGADVNVDVDADATTSKARLPPSDLLQVPSPTFVSAHDTDETRPAPAPIRMRKRKVPRPIPVDPAVEVMDDAAVEAALSPVVMDIDCSSSSSDDGDGDEHPVIFLLTQIQLPCERRMPGRPPHPLCPELSRTQPDRPAWAIDNNDIFADVDARAPSAESASNHVFAPLAEQWTRVLRITPCEVPLEKARSAR